MKNNKQKKEPLIHVSKNTVLPFWKRLIYIIASVVIALAVIALLGVLLIHKDPFSIFAAIAKGPFLDVWTLIKNAALLLGFAVAVVPAFKMKYFNMGANGQVLVGCLAAVACMKFLPAIKGGDGEQLIPNALIILCMVVSGVLASTIFALIPAFFKAFFDINETLFTLMTNYIAMKLVDYMVFLWDKSGSGTLKIVNQITKEGWFPEIGSNSFGGRKFLLTIIVVVLMTAFMTVYMKYTKHGFEASLVGESVNTAKYVGINVKKVVLRTIALSGVLCGILGVLYAGALTHTVNNAVGGLGFTAILVAWLSNFNPPLMALVSFLVVFLDTGTVYVASSMQLGSNDFSSICVGVVFFCVIAAQFFITYKVELTERGRKMFGKNKAVYVEGGIH